MDKYVGRAFWTKGEQDQRGGHNVSEGKQDGPCGQNRVRGKDTGDTGETESPDYAVLGS